MSQDALPVGAAIREATRFLEQTHKDLYGLITSLDALMQRRGWLPPENRPVTAGLGNSLGSELWVAKTVWRIYMPAVEKKTDALKNVGICGFALAPENYPEAVCLCIRANLLEAISFERLWSEWEWSGHDVLSALPEKREESFPVPQEVLKDRFIPAAASATAFVLPLEELQNEDALQQLVVGRLVESS